MKPILEPIHQNRRKTISAFVYNKPDFEMPWHFHPQHELTYIEKSTGTKFIGDFVGPYQPGELVLLRSNVPHCWKNHSSSDNRSVSNVVQWDKGIFAKIPELQPLFSLLGIASRGILFDLEGSKTLEKEIKKMPNLVGSNLYSALLKNLLKLTELSYTTLSEASFRDHMPSEFGTRMSKVHNFTERNYHRKIYLRELSDLINISEQSFARFFTKVMGRSFFVFLNEYRIKMAAKQLVDTDDSVAQIGFSCGFESPPFFFKKFKEAYGISPGKFRKKFRKGL